MIYLDTSSLLKLLYHEPESHAALTAVGAEEVVLVSVLAELEAQVQLKAAWLGGDYGKARYLDFLKRLAAFRELAPFRFVDLPASVFATAILQNRTAGDLHLRTLDRLHLAAMQELGVARLMTHDAQQERAARELQYEVLSPRANTTPTET
jgi:predicted nucleic acid-binding protein